MSTQLWKSVLRSAACGMLAACGVASAIAQEKNQESGIVTTEMLRSTTLRQNWPSYNGDYTGRRYSSLTQVTPQNAGQLMVKWVFHSRNAGILEATPVVVDGVMYMTGSNDAYALDAVTGKVLWHHQRSVTQGLIDDASGHINRGVAILGHRLYMETDNAHLLCLDARSGSLLWDVAYAPGNKNYGATSAPLVVKDKVLVGTSGGDDGVRGFIAAFDATTGKEAWRFWTIPAPGEPGSETWPKGSAYQHGGGTTWMPGTYDPELNTIYWGTSNPSPDFDGSVREGDNLYTNCVLALDPDTGKLKWHFQFTPHDLNDFDATETPVLIDAALKGKKRKLLVQANRNGFLYVLDRETGAYLQATQFVKVQNWAKGIDANGRPIRTDLIPMEEGTRMCPSYAGGTNWYSPTYSEHMRMFYFISQEDCSVYKAKPEGFEEGHAYYSTGATHLPTELNRKFLNAYDLSTQKRVWSYEQVGDTRSFAGVMSTATGLVAFGNPADEFEIVDGRDGRSLWHFNTGQQVHASPMSYAVDGKQYFAIAAGSDLFTFGLPDSAVGIHTGKTGRRKPTK
ncbi:MAG: PQQ-binding-like beta-propeller repeat protein [Edaphobacter sp.]|uniref:pyrroloquinoline quinone-dependent dehydrogenase n=1 Tax=Edaphobacter sp. TaxID=1934404 RepID=UPI0023860C6D|nr:PQQ-binding-like beta-propeller repeat protein [Edaphobacter sp.]MDE1177357.1 PQQ-binding-like beta-propeller repeat protein [Edaphobacter sp.]